VPETVSVFPNSGNGAFGAPQAAPGPFWASGIVAVDLDWDGDNDLAASDDSDNVTVSTNDGDGAFAYRDAYLVGEQADQPREARGPAARGRQALGCAGKAPDG
jgi:hypothetical protein